MVSLMNALSVFTVVAILYAIISIPVGLFNLKIFKAVHGAKCTGLNFIKAFIPFYNITFSRRLVYGKTTGFCVALLLCALMCLFRGISLVLVSTAPILIVYSSLVMIACIALYIILYIINAVDFCRMLNCGVVTVIVSIAIAPIGYYMLSTQVLSYFRSVEDTVSGRFGT